MRPDYHQAIIDTVKYYGWRRIIYLYDSHDGKNDIYYLVICQLWRTLFIKL
ncbi:hypothetical protein O3M35_001375 [Rhynocoris fuscipes]|uniref:Receptor ligand binding region domain-containing protein n=1 Tax=Rhynocoris fuscipes TaxID=488301 RepID=A0AAW1CQP2_9HEMI